MNALIKLRRVLVSHKQVLKQQIQEEEMRKQETANNPCLYTIHESKKRIRHVILLLAAFMMFFSYIIVQHNQSLEMEQITRSVHLKIVELNGTTLTYNQRLDLANRYKEELVDQMYTNRMVTGILFGGISMSMVMTVAFLDNRDYFIPTLNKKNCDIK